MGVLPSQGELLDISWVAAAGAGSVNGASVITVSCSSFFAAASTSWIGLLSARIAFNVRDCFANALLPMSVWARDKVCVEISDLIVLMMISRVMVFLGRLAWMALAFTAAALLRALASFFALIFCLSASSASRLFAA